jgi:glucose-6-phosphate isomerase
MPQDPTRQLSAYEGSLLRLDDPAIEVDFSRDFGDSAEFEAVAPRLVDALAAMAELEGGAIANADEDRRVGHYWLRAPGLAPTPEVEESIRGTIERIESFGRKVIAGEVTARDGARFERVLLVGIGGSALGPMLLADCFEGLGEGLPLTVLDNTDPDGIDRTLGELPDLRSTLFLVVSKSGGTPETRNGMREVQAACTRAGVEFEPRAVAVTGEGSKLDKIARENGWLERFPIPDWVGGRTSLFSAVGLLPAALGGIDVRALLAGAAAVDEWTRGKQPDRNPAARLAGCWYLQGNGRGEKNVVLLPYRDRLLLLSRYMQQLVMESIGKRLDRKGKEVTQGLNVFGNKGSTDQHAFVQQLRDGRADFIAHFVRVLHDRDGESIAVDENGATSGDYLDGFWLGTRTALYESGRPSVTFTIDKVDARSVAGLIALFERTVGLYAELIDINAYHQPGVEAGKKVAASVLSIQQQVLQILGAEPKTAAELAQAIEAKDAESVWHVLRHLAANRPGVRLVGEPRPSTARFVKEG